MSKASRSSFFANTFDLVKQIDKDFLQGKAPQLGAALAYYTVFSLPLLILVLLAIIGVIFRGNPADAWNKVEWKALKPNMPVTYTYTKEGDRMVVTKVTLAKPLSYYETKETTTTTTHP